jgi:hypothetical protein
MGTFAAATFGATATQEVCSAVLPLPRDSLEFGDYPLRTEVTDVSRFASMPLLAALSPRQLRTPRLPRARQTLPSTGGPLAATTPRLRRTSASRSHRRAGHLGW